MKVQKIIRFILLKKLPGNQQYQSWLQEDKTESAKFYLTVQFFCQFV